MQPLLQAKVVLQYDSLGQLAIRQFPAGSDAYKAGEERRVYLGDDITIVKHTDGTLDAVAAAPGVGVTLLPHDAAADRHAVLYRHRLQQDGYHDR